MNCIFKWFKYSSNYDSLKTLFLFWQNCLTLRFNAERINVDKNLVGSNHSEVLSYSLVIYVSKILDL